VAEPDRLAFPDGSEYAFLEKPADPQTQPLVMQFVLQPGAAGPPPHYHPDPVRETFTVAEGEFELKVDGDWRRLATGQSLTVEPGSVHTFRNESGAAVRVHNVHEPAHSFEQYMRGIARIVEDNDGTQMTPRAAVRMAQLIRAHPDTIRPAGAPMKVGVAALAGVARLLRLRPPG
jgi:quercetin dioxygenase-like cupin family protein